jgi:membrane protease subunit (stomatin/prohibitin family)
MGLGRFIQGQFRSVIQWEEPQDYELFYKWTEDGDEIKNASKLIVNPGQGCILVYEGKVQQVLEEEGLYDIKTGNIPFLTNLKKWMQLMESEHKVGIYFFRKAMILNARYGTPTPIKYQDPVYQFPVGLRAFGNYSFRITRAAEFFKEVVASATSYDTTDIQLVINSRISQPFADYLAKSKYTYTDIDANREDIVAELSTKLVSIFDTLGFEMKDLRIEGTSFDEDTQQRINKISDVAADVHAAKLAGLNYSELQKIEMMRDAAKNENGLAGMGAGIGAGLQMAGIVNNSQQPNSTSNSNDDIMAKLEKLKLMHEKALITAEEYENKKAKLLDLL